MYHITSEMSSEFFGVFVLIIITSENKSQNEI